MLGCSSTGGNVSTLIVKINSLCRAWNISTSCTWAIYYRYFHYLRPDDNRRSSKMDFNKFSQPFQPVLPDSTEDSPPTWPTSVWIIPSFHKLTFFSFYINLPCQFSMVSRRYPKIHLVLYFSWQLFLTPQLTVNIGILCDFNDVLTVNYIKMVLLRSYFFWQIFLWYGLL